MQIIDLDDCHEDLFCVCLEEWKEESLRGGPRRKEWLRRVKERGLRAKLAVDEAGVPGGMIQYLPIEDSFVSGSNLLFVCCIFVHAMAQGRGNYQGRGMGRALIEHAEQEARSCGATGIAAWGIDQPFWMPAAFFEKFGFVEADREENRILVWKPFVDDAHPPRWRRRSDKPLELVPGKVTVTAFVSGWCMGQNIIYEWAKSLARQYGDDIVYREIETHEPAVADQWGLTDAIFVDDEQLPGPPMEYDDVKAVFDEHVQTMKAATT